MFVAIYYPLRVVKQIKNCFGWKLLQQGQYLFIWLSCLLAMRRAERRCASVVQVSSHDRCELETQTPEFFASMMPTSVPWLEHSAQYLVEGFILPPGGKSKVKECPTCKRFVLAEAIDSGSHASWCRYDPFEPSIVHANAMRFFTSMFEP